MTEQEYVRTAMNRSLSGLTEDPLLAGKILAREKEQTKVKKKATLGLVLAAALVLVTMTAAVAAERLGLFDLLPGMNIRVAPEAASLVTTPEAQHTLAWEHVSLHVTEVIRSDDTAIALLEITPTDDNTLIVPEEWLTQGDLPAAGKQVIALRTLRPSLRIPGKANAEILYGSTWDAVQAEDGSLQMLFRLACPAEDATIRLRFETIPVMQTGVSPASIAFTLKAADVPAGQTRRAAGLPLEIPEYGVRIDEVTLTTTALRSTAQLTCTVANRAVYDTLFEDVFFVCCDENGDFLGAGLGGRNSHAEVDEDTFIRTSHFAPYTGDTLYIKVYEFGSAAPLAELVVPME